MITRTSIALLAGLFLGACRARSEDPGMPIPPVPPLAPRSDAAKNVCLLPTAVADIVVAGVCEKPRAALSESGFEALVLTDPSGPLHRIHRQTGALLAQYYLPRLPENDMGNTLALTVQDFGFNDAGEVILLAIPAGTKHAGDAAENPFPPEAEIDAGDLCFRLHDRAAPEILTGDVAKAAVRGWHGSRAIP